MALSSANETQAETCLCTGWQRLRRPEESTSIPCGAETLLLGEGAVIRTTRLRTKRRDQAQGKATSVCKYPFSTAALTIRLTSSGTCSAINPRTAQLVKPTKTTEHKNTDEGRGPHETEGTISAPICRDSS